MKIDPDTLNLKGKAVSINGVTKVVRGGRSFRFSALAAIGDENGHTGVGTGKSIEILGAIREGIGDVEKNLVEVSIVGTVIPHEIHGEFDTGDILIIPVTGDTGAMAGGPVRPVPELAGLEDVRAKSLGSNNPRNMVKTTTNGSVNLRTVEDIVRLREKPVGEIIG